MTKKLKTIAKKLLALLGYRVVQMTQGGQGYRSCAETLRRAKKENLSLFEYINKLWGGNKIDHTIKRILAHTPVQIESILEIGPGTGVYIKSIIYQLNLVPKIPLSSNFIYEIYEPAKDWAQYLTAEYDFVKSIEGVDGFSLCATESNSMNLIHARGVFVYIPFLSSVTYSEDSIRCAKKNGIIAFDVLDESCFLKEDLASWLKSEHRYPVIVPSFNLKFFLKTVAAL